MRYRALTANGDMTFGRGAANYLTDAPAAVVQAVKTRLQLIAGEWFLDLAAGTPYPQGVFGYNAPTADYAIRQRILETEGVTAITEFESIFDAETRAKTIRATIATIYGDASLTARLGEAR